MSNKRQNYQNQYEQHAKKARTDLNAMYNGKKFNFKFG